MILDTGYGVCVVGINKILINYLKNHPLQSLSPHVNMIRGQKEVILYGWQ